MVIFNSYVKLPNVTRFFCQVFSELPDVGVEINPWHIAVQNIWAKLKQHETTKQNIANIIYILL